MDLNIIPFSTLQGALDAAEATDQETDRFNTHFHTHTEIAAVIQESAGASHKHVYPDLTACHFSNWIDLIASSQGFEEWHEIILPPSLVQELLDANAVWTLTGKAISEDAMEDLLARFPKQTSRAIKTKAVFHGQKEWFLRLDFCSTKDARGEGGTKYTSTVRTIEDALQRICASKRAIRALEDIVLKKAPGPARLLFIPHNKHMDTSREFRVFCPPLWTLSALSSNHLREATPNQSRDDGHTIARITAYRNTDGILHTTAHPLPRHKKMQRKPSRTPSPSTPKSWPTQRRCRTKACYRRCTPKGFVFDIFETTNGDMQLLEINPFGAMSGCGSCLFHWIDDAPLLYGAREGVEVRLTM